MRGTGKKQVLRYYLLYTAIFALAAGVIYSFYSFYDKSFVYAPNGDGHVYFNAFVYYGRWLREILMTLLREHTLTIPMWDLGIGYGSDILLTLNCVVLGDPLNLLSALCPADSAETLYGILAIFRIYLAGISFSVFSRYHGNRNMPVLIGSIMYAFCGYSLFAGVRDVAFMMPMVYFPLLALGIDKIFEKKKPYTFIIVCTLAGITNFYLYYIICVWTFLYGVYRYFMLFGKIGLQLKQIGRWLFRFIAFFAVGLAMAAILILPITMYLMNSERFTADDYIPLLYPLQYYWDLLTKFTVAESVDSWSHLGYTPLTLIAVILLFIKKEKELFPYKVAFIICVLFLMLPAVGSLMNAGSYPTNRWVWAFSFLVSYIFVKLYPKLLILSDKEKLMITVICLAYGGICCFVDDSRTTHMVFMQMLLFASVLTFFISSLWSQGKRFFPYMILAGVFLGVIANGSFRNAYWGADYASGFVESGKAWESIHDSIASRSIETLPNADIVRYDSLGELEPMFNTAMNHGINSTNFYYSLADGDLTDYFDELHLNVEMEHRYKGLDERSALEWLSAVQYCIVGTDSTAFRPATYDTKEAETENYIVYSSEYALPLGYTYDSYITTKAYQGLTALEKQQVMLQSVVMEETDSAYSMTEPVFCDQQLEWSIQAGDGMTIQDGRIDVIAPGAEAVLTVEGIADSEIYINFDQIVFENTIKDQPEAANIIFKRDNSSKDMILYSRKHSFYHGRDGYLLNTGYYKEAETVEITIQFMNAGVYHTDGMNVLAQPIQPMKEQQQERSATVLENMIVSSNTVEGTINTGAKEKLLCLPIPYSEGWTAYVDGEKVTVERMNTAWIGIKLPEGEHSIRFSYTTPFLHVGAFITMAGILAFLGICVFYTVQKRRKRV